MLCLLVMTRRCTCGSAAYEVRYSSHLVGSSTVFRCDSCQREFAIDPLLSMLPHLALLGLLSAVMLGAGLLPAAVAAAALWLSICAVTVHRITRLCRHPELR